MILSVVTWNMHGGRGDLRRLVDDLASGELTGAPAREYVLLLQEAIEGGEHDVAALARAKGLSTFFIPVRSGAGRPSGNAILSTRPLVNARAISLPQERQPRNAVAATVEIDGRRLFVADVHLENRVSWLRGGLLSDVARGRQARALLDALPADEPGILGGDLNTWLGREEPAWRVLAQRFDDTPQERLAPTFRDRLILDHLFFDLPDGWRAAIRVPAAGYGSDHRPVVGVIF